MAKPINWLHQIWEQLCCLLKGQTASTEAIVAAIENGGGGSYNSIDQIQLNEGGTDTKVFNIGDVHSVSWGIVSGTVTLTIGGGGTTEYSSSGSVEFSTYNEQTLTFEIVTGETELIWMF